MTYYKELIVWQKAHDLALEVYKVTQKFPKTEIYALTSQVRRAATSIPANIVEGNSRKSNKDKSRFLEIARGSLAETEYFIELSRDLGYLDKQENMLDSLLKQTAALLWRFQESLDA
jgi:four helix bundle protein